mmetsp:Transcript_10356/g.8911  ORF Transcript_10356/g.8911 Transcript_10356/m.8911 type:complete len:124 (-) Transcript_10356:795-1166(-)
MMTKSPKNSIQTPSMPKLSFKNLQIREKICRGKYSVYRAECNYTGQSYAVKVFPYKDYRISPYYTNEKKLLGYQHPNIAFPILSLDKKECKSTADGIQYPSSLICYEYLPHQTLFELIISNDV